MTLIQWALAFLVAIGVLVTIHEYGHFWVARKCGVKVLRFSIGFGKPLFTKTGKDGVEYSLSAIPLGGYVKMLDEAEGDVAPAERAQAFNRKPLASRLAVVLAGPAANLIFAVAAFWLAFMLGIEGVRPVIGEVEAGGVADTAGMRTGQVVVKVDGDSVSTWDRVFQRIARASLNSGSVDLVVRADGGAERNITLDMTDIPLDDLSEGRMFSRLGFAQARPHIDAVLGPLVSGGAAERAGLEEGDRVLSIAGEPMGGWADLVKMVRANPGKALEVEVTRGSERLSLTVTPDPHVEADAAPIGRIGANWRNDPELLGAFRGVEKYAPVEALGRAFARVGDTVTLILSAAWKMLTLELSPKNVSGPVQIAEYAALHASIGMVYFLTFLGFVSVSLGVINLLPVPMLDGGHVLYYVIEGVRGKPLSIEAQMVGQRIGVALIIGLMGLAFYNDFARYVGRFLG